MTSVSESIHHTLVRTSPAGSRGRNPSGNFRNSYAGLHPLVGFVSGSRARWLVRHGAAAPADFPDMQQEIAVSLVLAMRRAEERDGGWTPALLSAVGWRRCLELYRRAPGKCARRAGEVCSLSAAHESDRGSLAMRPWQRSRRIVRVLGRNSARPEAEALQLRLDFHAVMELLPEPTREICRRLLTSSRDEVCRELGVAPRTMQRHMARMREHFAAHGMGDYVGLPAGGKAARSDSVGDQVREPVLRSALPGGRWAGGARRHSVPGFRGRPILMPMPWRIAKGEVSLPVY